ncbi:MAG: nucleotidyltransferase domain-containing protein [Candidatus Methanoperedens sp.]|nr:nucleotidyltransferase domain-containing protein [Candidatus Methanoperedens sp.]
MDIDLDKLKSITDEAMKISMIKMLVFKNLNEKIKTKIDSKPNNFYEPKEQDIKTKENFNSFINSLSDRIIKEGEFSYKLSEKLVSELKEKFHDDLCSVILFGSYAKGTAQPYSDLDTLIILNRKFANWTERGDLEIELRKRLNRTVGQVSPKVGSVEELEAALKAHDPLILNILDSGIALYDDGTFAKLKEHFKQITSTEVVKRADYWEVVA